MAEEIGFENGSNSNFQGLVTLTLTLDPAIRHTVMHHSSTSTCIPNFIEMKKLFVDGRTDVRTVWTDGHFPPLILLGRLLEVDLGRLLEVDLIITSGGFRQSPYKCRNFAKIVERVSVRVKKRVKVSILVRLQFSAAFTTSASVGAAIFIAV